MSTPHNHANKGDFAVLGGISDQMPSHKATHIPLYGFVQAFWYCTCIELVTKKKVERKHNEQWR